MPSVLRMTLQTRLVLQVLLSEPTGQHYGLQLCAETGLAAGTIYPILARLEQAGWVESCWEDPATHIAEGRPRRRYYRLTGQGAVQAAEALRRAERARTRLLASTPRGAPGVSW
jgi:PadR family transcriptional regulator, regulatory protein PadR